MTDDARTVVDTYFSAWRDNDFTTMRSVLDDKVDFVVHKTFVDGADVLTWYDLHTRIADPAPVAEWSHVENGKITMVRVVFDARPFSPPANH
jgi:hypothetical protein